MRLCTGCASGSRLRKCAGLPSQVVFPAVILALRMRTRRFSGLDRGSGHFLRLIHHIVYRKKKKIIHPASRVRCVEIHTLLDTVSLATFSAGTVAFSCTEDITVDPCDSGSHTHIASHSLGSDSNTRVDMMIFSRILARAAVFDIPAIRSISRQEQIASHTGRWCTYSWL
ncbi:hypothetical protein B0H13DRAFT_1093702 [Mycena leptocephala]|nr:hypothetical protein B0H13DRAFT_1093702 [Mycena leptocephala]